MFWTVCTKHWWSWWIIHKLKQYIKFQSGGYFSLLPVKSDCYTTPPPPSVLLLASTLNLCPKLSFQNFFSLQNEPISVWFWEVKWIQDPWPGYREKWPDHLRKLRMATDKQKRVHSTSNTLCTCAFMSPLLWIGQRCRYDAVLYITW